MSNESPWPRLPVGSEETVDLVENEVRATVKRFDHQNGGDFPGSRGVMISSTTVHDYEYAFSNDFPWVFISDNGEVDAGAGRFRAADYLAWMDAIRPYVAAAAADNDQL